jgi:hypothetical protein
MGIRIIRSGTFPQLRELCIGTTAEIQAYVPAVESAEGRPTDAPGLWYFTPAQGWQLIVTALPAPL